MKFDTVHRKKRIQFQKKNFFSNNSFFFFCSSYCCAHILNDQNNVFLHFFYVSSNLQSIEHKKEIPFAKNGIPLTVLRVNKISIDNDILEIEY